MFMVLPAWMGNRQFNDHQPSTKLETFQKNEMETSGKEKAARRGLFLFVTPYLHPKNPVHPEVPSISKIPCNPGYGTFFAQSIIFIFRMSLHFTWINLLILFGAIQALVFAVVLLFQRKHPGVAFLATFIFVFA